MASWAETNLFIQNPEAGTERLLTESQASLNGLMDFILADTDDGQNNFAAASGEEEEEEEAEGDEEEGEEDHQQAGNLMNESGSINLEQTLETLQFEKALVALGRDCARQAAALLTKTKWTSNRVQQRLFCIIKEALGGGVQQPTRFRNFQSWKACEFVATIPAEDMREAPTLAAALSQTMATAWNSMDEVEKKGFEPILQRATKSNASAGDLDWIDPNTVPGVQVICPSNPQPSREAAFLRGRQCLRELGTFLEHHELSLVSYLVDTDVDRASRLAPMHFSTRGEDAVNLTKELNRHGLHVHEMAARIIAAKRKRDRRAKAKASPGYRPKPTVQSRKEELRLLVLKHYNKMANSKLQRLPNGSLDAACSKAKLEWFFNPPESAACLQGMTRKKIFTWNHEPDVHEQLVKCIKGSYQDGQRRMGFKRIQVAASAPAAADVVQVDLIGSCASAPLSSRS